MTVEGGRFAQPNWPVAVLVAVPLLGLADAVGPPPAAAVAFAGNLAVLGVAGHRALFPRPGLSAIERATVALALPIAVLVLGTIAAAAIGLHLDRQLWAAMVALVAEAAAAGLLLRRGQPGGRPGAGRRWPVPPPPDGRVLLWYGSLAAAGAVLAAAIALSVWTATSQAYPAFSALSAIRVGAGGHSVQVQLTSEETSPTRFIVAVSVGRTRPEPITVQLTAGATWRKTIPAPRSAAVTVVAYRGSRPGVAYRRVRLAPRADP